MTPATPPRDTYHHGNLRTALLEGALEVLATEGPHALSLRELARREGVSPAAPYRHFPDKEALLAAIAEQGFVDLTERMRRARDAESDPVGRFLALGLAYTEFAREQTAHYQVMFGPLVPDRSAHPTLEAAAAATYDLLRDAIVEGQRAGVLRTEEPETFAIAAWATVHGLASLLVDGQLADPGGEALDRRIGAVLAALFVGLGRTSGS